MHDFLRSDAVWRQFLYNLEDYAIVFLDQDGLIVAWNKGAQILKGYEAEEVIGSHFSRFYTSEAVASGHPERELAVAASVGRYEEEGWRVRKDGSLFWASVIIRPIYDNAQVLRGFGKVLRDFTERKQLNDQTKSIVALLEVTSRSDYLTGLDNRRSLDAALTSEISAARRHARPLTLAMIDLDRFKMYNDEFGHQAGDRYLKHVARVWRKTLRPEDFIARYGGEEFVVILPNTPLSGAAACLERLRGATLAPLTCSLGIAEWNRQETASELIGRADRALYQAKQMGRDRMVSSE